MTDYCYAHRIRIFGYPKWAEPLREALRENMERIATDNAIAIEFVRSKKSSRKEDRVKEILVKRETNRAWCASFQPWSHAAAISRGTTSRLTRPI